MTLNGRLGISLGKRCVTLNFPIQFECSNCSILYLKKQRIQSVLLSSTGISSQLYRRSERIASDIKLLKNHEKHENILTPLNLPKCWIIAAVQITQKPSKSTVFWYESWKSICPSKNNPKMCFTSNIFGAITRKNTLVSPLMSSASINPCGGYNTHSNSKRN